MTDQTKGHLADHGGLRGHSVGEVYPWRIVGYGDGSWAVVDVTGQKFARYFGDNGNDLCQRVAEYCKARWPDGRIPEGTDPCLY